MTGADSGAIVSAMTLPYGVALHTPGSKIESRCTHCSNVREVTVYRCIWPDNKMTVERFCAECDGRWRQALQDLGCRLDPPFLQVRA